MDKSDMPYELEHACCWRCCSFISLYGAMGCKIHTRIKVEPNHFCNSFAVSEEDRKKQEDTP